jgi:hypothetical protein
MPYGLKMVLFVLFTFVASLTVDRHDSDLIDPNLSSGIYPDGGTDPPHG